MVLLAPVPLAAAAITSYAAYELCRLRSSYPITTDERKGVSPWGHAVPHWVPGLDPPRWVHARVPLPSVLKAKTGPSPIELLTDAFYATWTLHVEAFLARRAGYVPGPPPWYTGPIGDEVVLAPKPEWISNDRCEVERVDVPAWASAPTPSPTPVGGVRSPQRVATPAPWLSDKLEAPWTPSLSPRLLAPPPTPASPSNEITKPAQEFESYPPGLFPVLTRKDDGIMTCWEFAPGIGGLQILAARVDGDELDIAFGSAERPEVMQQGRTAWLAGFHLFYMRFLVDAAARRIRRMG